MNTFEENNIIDGYKIIKKIAEGGNSFVYKVEKDGRFYALKILKYRLRDQNKQRFNDEVEFQSRTRCKYIVKILHIGETKVNVGKKNRQNRMYYVMDLFECSFDKLIERDNNFQHLLKLYLDICEALKFIHNYSKGKIIHRDIKPQNFLYDKENDRLLLADFGIAHFNKKHPIKTNDKKVGNFSYSAPEQRKNKNKKYGTYTDIFSMGLILNEIFTKEIPNGVGYRLIKEVSPIYFLLDDVVFTMLQNEPKDRESNIANVINKIKYNVEIYEKNVKNILIDFGGQFDKLSDDDKSRTAEDIALLKIYFKMFENDNKIFNQKYHADTFYYYTKSFIDSLKLINLYKLITNKFDYENDIPKKELFVNNIAKTSQFKRLILILESLHYFKEGELIHICNQIITLFKTLEEHHQYEILDEYQKQKIREKGSIYNIFEDFLELNKYEKINFEFSMSSYLKIPEHVNFNDEKFFIYDYQKVKRSKYIEVASNYNLTAIYDDYNKVTIICYDKKYLEAFSNKIDRMLNGIKNNVLESDLIDCKNVIKQLVKNNYVTTHSYIFEITLCKKVLDFETDKSK